MQCLYWLILYFTQPLIILERCLRCDTSLAIGINNKKDTYKHTNAYKKKEIPQLANREPLQMYRLWIIWSNKIYKMWQLGLAVDKIYCWSEAVSTAMRSLTEVHSVIHLNIDLFSSEKKVNKLHHQWLQIFKLNWIKPLKSPKWFVISMLSSSHLLSHPNPPQLQW